MKTLGGVDEVRPYKNEKESSYGRGLENDGYASNQSSTHL